jgi:hypothetical protein
MRLQKTETLTVRLVPDIKAALREAGDREHRGLANLLEVLIRDWHGGREKKPLARPQSAQASRSE